MIMINKLDQSRIIKVWIDEMPYQYKQKGVKQFVYKGNQSVQFHEGFITVEVKLNSRHISNYAMISMEYQKKNSDELIIEVVSDDSQVERYDSEIYKNRKKIMGINSEFIDGIINFIDKYDSSRLPTGKIIILGGGYDEISSSIKAFERVMDILFFIYQELSNCNIEGFNKKIVKKCSLSYGEIIKD